MITARVKVENGMPHLYINEKRQVPLLFFANTDLVYNYDVSAKGIKMASNYGFHIHSVPTVLPVHQEKGSRDFSHALNSLQLAIDSDPEAMILLRVNMSIRGKHAIQWAENHPDDLMRFAVYDQDGIKGMDSGDEHISEDAISIVSEEWFKAALDTLEEFNNILKQTGIYGKHLLGYHIGGGETGEWFHVGLREKGLDISETNRKGFIKYLKEKYTTVHMLNKAWQTNHRSFEDINLPIDIWGNDRSVPAKETLFISEQTQKYVDYGLYASWIVSERILAFSSAARQMTNGEKILAFFYGYYFELYDARTGHFDLNRILSCKDIDMLSSPICYMDRNEGGIGALMSPVDSIILHGKLWMIENDIRTLLAYRTDEMQDTWPKVQTIEGIQEVYRREAGTMLAHGCGCWYMDLLARGWQYHPDIWENNAEIRKEYIRMQPNFCPIEADVAVCVDEKAMSTVAHAEAVGMQLLSNFRMQFFRAGVKFGFYTVEDIIEGLVPSAKVIFLLNPFDMNYQRAKSLKEALKKINASLVFVHGSGRSDLEGIRELTGFNIQAFYGEMFSLNMEGIYMPLLQPVISDCCAMDTQRSNPAYTVLNRDVDILARYTEGKLKGQAALAFKDNVCFFGGLCMTPELIRLICARFGVHLYQHDNQACIIGNETITIHTGDTDCEVNIYLPQNETYQDLFGKNIYTNTKCIKKFCKRHATLLLKKVKNS